VYIQKKSDLVLRPLGKNQTNIAYLLFGLSEVLFVLFFFADSSFFFSVVDTVFFSVAAGVAGLGFAVAVFAVALEFAFGVPAVFSVAGFAATGFAVAVFSVAPVLLLCPVFAFAVAGFSASLGFVWAFVMLVKNKSAIAGKRIFFIIDFLSLKI
jgi:hypothetical protein